MAAQSASPRWKFPPVRMEGTLTDPVQSQFFTTDTVGGVGRALVRECIQNVLDARRNDAKTVEVHFNFVDVTLSQVKSFFRGLEPHLVANANGLHTTDSHLPETMRFLVIEDFGTRGLSGKPDEFSLKPSKDNGFFYFWRNTGRSGKSDENRGRWGLGKAVFPATSKIHTFFGLTKRPHDIDTTYLLGQSILKHHMIDDREYKPEGYFGLFGEKESKREYFAMPVTDETMIQQLYRIFNMRRDGEAGLSLLIALPYEEITAERIVAAVAEQYFYPILANRLVVEVDGWRITGENLADVLQDALKRLADSDSNDNTDNDPFETTDPQTFRHTLEFTQWAMTLDETDHFQFERPDNPEAAPYWNEHYLNPLSDDTKSAWREQFAQTGRAAFYVPVKVQRTDAPLQWSRFRVYLERDERLSRAQNYFIREGITITGLRTLTQRDMRGMVVLDSDALEKPLTTMLGDAENPAHTEWQKDSQNFKGKYEHGASTINFVKYSLRYLTNMLTTIEHEVDKDLLQDIFFLEKPPEKPDNPKTPKPDDGTDDDERESSSPAFPDLPRSESPVQIVQRATGISVTPNPAADTPIASILLRFAYDVRRGSAFKRYSPFDFRLDDAGSPDVTRIQFNVQGGTVEQAEENRLRVQIHQPDDFRIEVSGFSHYRDLVVRSRWERTDT